MADAVNGGAEDVLVTEEEVVKEEELALKGVVEGSVGGVTEKIDVVEESVEEGGVSESLNIPDGEELTDAVKEKVVLVETAPIPVESEKATEILDPVMVESREESSGTAYAVAKELEETPTEPPAVVVQEEIPESTGNPPVISASTRTLSPTTWRSCCGLFDALRRP